jgi:hypothetical protein
VSPEPLSRRGFLAATGGLALAATLHLDVLSSEAAAASTALSALTVSIDPYVSRQPQRIGLVLYRGAKPLAGPAVKVAFAPPGSNQATMIGTKLYKAGLPGGRGVYVSQPVLDQPGNWNGVVLVQGKQVRFVLQVKASAEVPVIGSTAPRAASPTMTDALGVKPICTRDPVCPLHTTSLSDVIGTSKPVAVMFATPALCQTATCGPVLDQLLTVRTSYEDRVAFVHVEIYQSNKGVEVSPTVAAWNLPGEPWLFAVDGTGIIRGRLDGAFGRDEVRALVAALAG